MPFKSEEHKQYLYANEPEVAKKFAKEEKTEAYKKKKKRNYKRALGVSKHAGYGTYNLKTLKKKMKEEYDKG